jgi:hypothetical protein
MKTSIPLVTSLLLFLNSALLAQLQTGNIITGGSVYDGLEKCVAANDKHY